MPGAKRRGARSTMSMTSATEALGRAPLSIASMLSAGTLPNMEAALVKDLGTQFQQELPQIAREVLQALPDSERKRAYKRLLDRGILAAPAYTIQGGTTEILRGIIARGLGLR